MTSYILGDDELISINPHKPLRKTKATVITRLTARFTCGLVPDVVIWELKECDVYDVECPYWDQASLNITLQPNLVPIERYWLHLFMWPVSKAQSKGKDLVCSDNHQYCHWNVIMFSNPTLTNFLVKQDILISNH